MAKKFSLDGVIIDLSQRIKREADPAERERLKRRLLIAKRVKARFAAMEGQPEKATIERATR